MKMMPFIVIKHSQRPLSETTQTCIITHCHCTFVHPYHNGSGVYNVGHDESVAVLVSQNANLTFYCCMSEPER